jgi:hypothetical protein
VISYEEFGRRFFEHAVTEQRIVAGLGGLTGEPISFGPMGVGPGRMAQVTANGLVGEGSAQRVPGDEVRFRLSIPIELDLDINLGVDHHRFHASMTVGLDIHARAAEPLRVVIEIEPPAREDVAVKLTTEAVRSEVLRRVAGIDREIGRFVAKYVARELDKPGVKEARDIDVAARIDSAWRT